jgi:hypothetical protein
MTNDGKITILSYAYSLLVISGGLMLVAGVSLKIYRTINKQTYPSQPKWGAPELLAVIGFFVFALTEIAAGFFP